MNIDQKSYNGWPNVFTWHVYNHLSSYEDTYAAACGIVAQAATPFAAEDALRSWVQGMAEALYDSCSVSGVQLLYQDLTIATLGQVDWKQLVEAFQE